MSRSPHPAPLRVLVVDDEAPARQRLLDLLADLAVRFPLEIVGEAADAAAALAQLARGVDVLLLDIRMPGTDGIALAGLVQALPDPPAIVFTTAFDSYALRAFDLHAVDYLLKPVRLERLAQALARARVLDAAALGALQALPRPRRDHLSAVHQGRLVLIPVPEILFLRARDKYLQVQTRTGAWLVEESLDRLAVEFSGLFLRIHRNCLVHTGHLAAFERTHAGWHAVLRDWPERLAVSRRQQHLVRAFRPRRG